MNKHVTSKSHGECATRWEEYRRSAASGSVADQLSSSHRERAKKRREYLARIAELILFLSKQGLAFRGDDETAESLNKGNFLELVNLMRTIDPSFSLQMDRMPSNASYLSPVSQNALIDTCADMVKQSIIADMQEAQFVAVLADEARDVSKMEQLSICIRFVSPDLRQIREEFLGFHQPTQRNATSLAEHISGEIARSGIHNSLVVAQCYDGASVMAGKYNGVQAILRLRFPNAIYVHCHAHRLNLVLVDTVQNIRPARDFFALVEALYVFLSHPCAHQRFVDFQREQGLPIRELQRLSDTRWASRWRSLDTIRERFLIILQVLSPSDPPLNKHEVVEARGLLAQIRTLSFICCLCVFHRLLSLTNGLSESLQSTHLNLAQSIQLLSAVKDLLRGMRTNNDAGWNDIWKTSTDMCTSCNVRCTGDDIDIRPRRKRQLNEYPDYVYLSFLGQQPVMHESGENSAANNYRMHVFYPVLDRFLHELETRFTSESWEIMQAVQALLLPQAKNFLCLEDIIPFVKTYGEVLNINQSLLQAEVAVAKQLLASKQPPTKDFAGVIQCIADDGSFYNLRLCMRIAMTLPVSSATCERSFSSMKYIKNYLRNKMTDQRLSSLAILYMCRERTALLDPDAVVAAFANANPRALTFV